MRCQTSSFCSPLIDTQCATSTTVRPQPRHTSSNVVEHTATQGVSGRSPAGCPAAPAILCGGTDIELVPAIEAELFQRCNVLIVNHVRFREGLDGALDAVFAQQVQGRVWRAV